MNSSISLLGGDSFKSMFPVVTGPADIIAANKVAEETITKASGENKLELSVAKILKELYPGNEVMQKMYVEKPQEFAWQIGYDFYTRIKEVSKIGSLKTLYEHIKHYTNQFLNGGQFANVQLLESIKAAIGADHFSNIVVSGELTVEQKSSIYQTLSKIGAGLSEENKKLIYCVQNGKDILDTSNRLLKAYILANTVTETTVAAKKVTKPKKEKVQPVVSAVAEQVAEVVVTKKKGNKKATKQNVVNPDTFSEAMLRKLLNEKLEKSQGVSSSLEEHKEGLKPIT